MESCSQIRFWKAQPLALLCVTQAANLFSLTPEQTDLLTTKLKPRSPISDAKKALIRAFQICGYSSGEVSLLMDASPKYIIITWSKTRNNHFLERKANTIASLAKDQFTKNCNQFQFTQKGVGGMVKKLNLLIHNENS